MSEIAERILAALNEVHNTYEEPDADQRTAAYWWGRKDESVAWALCSCKLAAAHPVAQSLYLAHVADDISKFRQIKEWSYIAAAELAVVRRGPRNRKIVEDYAPYWAHQAARDGVALALWPEIPECIPGIGTRCALLGASKQAYQRIRDGVRSEARSLIEQFRDDLQGCLHGAVSRDFEERFARAISGMAA